MTVPPLLRRLLLPSTLPDLGLAPCAGQASDILVGQVAGQSGPFADAVRDYIAGARTYFDHANSTGGVHGSRIDLRIRDDGGDHTRTAALTRDLIDQDRVDVLFGYFGDANVAEGARSEAYARSGIALGGAVSGLDPGEGVANLFFTRASYDGEIRRVIEQFRGMGIRRFGIASAALESPRSVAARAAAIVRDAQAERAATVEFSAEGRDPSEAVRKLRGSQPQLVLVIADTVATAGFIKAWRQGDAGTFLVGLSLVNHTTVMELLGPKLATGTLITQIVPDPAKSELAVVGEHLRLMKKYRDEPPSHLTLEGFLAAKTLVIALRKARKGASRAEIASAMRSLDRADLGGVNVGFGTRSRGYSFVDIAFLRRNGTLLR